jgi:hypothetical protein
MTNQTNEITLPMDAAEWPRLFHESNFDCVLDPMVVRAADFFIGGPDYCRAMGQGATADHWPVIESNFDGVLAFFHILMTRDRIPLIDYWHTFDSKLHSWLGDSVVLKVHGGPVYRGIEQKALAKLSTVVDTLPQGASLDLDKELLEVGHFWQPNLGDVAVRREAQSAARFVLGGLIFGEYAQMGGADHLLQCKRLRMMTALGHLPAPLAPDWNAEERALFKEIDTLANTDRILSVRNQEVLPNVLLHLLAGGRRSPRALLDDALKIRESSAGRDYRALHCRLREAWSLGRRNEDAERQVGQVTAELRQRISGQPMELTAIEVQGTIKANAGVRAELGVAAAGLSLDGSVHVPKTRISVTVPDRIRNWFVDQFVLKGHQKLLLRMALHQRSFADVRKGLHEVWRSA